MQLTCSSRIWFSVSKCSSPVAGRIGFSISKRSSHVAGRIGFSVSKCSSPVAGRIGFSISKCSSPVAGKIWFSISKCSSPVAGRIWFSVSKCSSPVAGKIWFSISKCSSDYLHVLVLRLARQCHGCLGYPWSECWMHQLLTIVCWQEPSTERGEEPVQVDLRRQLWGPHLLGGSGRQSSTCQPSTQPLSDAFGIVIMNESMKKYHKYGAYSQCKRHTVHTQLRFSQAKTTKDMPNIEVHNNCCRGSFRCNNRS